MAEAPSPAEEALAVLAVDPLGLHGAVLRARPGPHLDAWVAAFRDLLGEIPLRHLPIHAQPGRLTGEVDLVASVATGARRIRTGLLAEAHGSVLMAPMAERMTQEVATTLAAVLDTGRVEPRESGVEPWPSRVALLLVDESRDDDPPPPELLVERMGVHLALQPRPLGAPPLRHPTPAAVAGARARLPSIRLSPDQEEILATLALDLGIPSLRPVLAAGRVARAAAALAGRDAVQEEDLRTAVALALLPRARVMPRGEEADELEDPSQAPEPPPPPDSPPDAADSEGAPDAPTQEEVRALADRVLEAAAARLPEGIQALQEVGRATGVGRRGRLIRQLERGHRVGARPGDLRRGGSMDLSSTLRAAAPWQPHRRERALERRGRGGEDGSGSGPGRGSEGGAEAAPRPLPAVLVEPDDIHIQIRAKRSATATIFVVDASGSQALHRLAEAKGAVELLLADSYVRREEVAMVVFRGRSAEVALPPTRSLVRARRTLSGIPGGGGTPLALGLMEALTLALRIRAAEANPRIVLLSDGRPNVTREGEGGRPRAREDALAAARLIRAQGITAMVLDTSNRGEAFTRELAAALGGPSLHLPRADARGVRDALRRLDPPPGKGP